MKERLMAYLKRYTDLGDDALKTILDDVPILHYKKGTLLLAQGDVVKHCYFILDGLVRKYGLDGYGHETTYGFYSEHQAVVIFDAQMGEPSGYNLVCAEDCVLLIGSPESAAEACDTHDGLEAMLRAMTEGMMGTLQEEHAAFIASSPEERYRYLLAKRPTLINRVPQHQLASYLGIAPESLSRIKRRLLMKEA